MDKGYQAHQLRLDKIIYASEAVATNLACLLVFMLGDKYFVGATRDGLMLGAVSIGVGYTIYMGIGNGIRLFRIRKMEKDL